MAPPEGPFSRRICVRGTAGPSVYAAGIRPQGGPPATGGQVG